MVNVRIDREMIIEELYALRALIPVEAYEAKAKVSELVSLVQNAPNDEKKSNYPRISTHRK